MEIAIKDINGGKMQVTAAIILKGNRFLIAKRKNDGWEFPGGRVEGEESYEECLIREIKEELDLEIKKLRLFTVVSGEIELHVYLAKCEGEPLAKEHEEIRWIGIKDVDKYNFLTPDMKVVEELKRRWKEVILFSAYI